MGRKNRVQPANLLQAKCFFLGPWRGRIGGSPHFSLLNDFCHGLLAPDDDLRRGLEGNEHLAGDGLSPNRCRVKGRRQKDMGQI